MDKDEWMLLGSAPTEDRIIKIISQYFYSSNIELIPFSENVFVISTLKGVLEKFRVIKKGKRFRFEQRLID